MPSTEDILLHPSLHPSIHSFIHLSVHLFTYPSIHPLLSSFYLFPIHPCRSTSSRKASLISSVSLDSPHFCWFLIVYNIQFTIKLYNGLDFSFFFLIYLLNFIQLQLSAFSPLPSTPPQPIPPPSPTSTLPLDFVLVSFIVAPVDPSPHYPFPTPLCLMASFSKVLPYVACCLTCVFPQ